MAQDTLATLTARVRQIVDDRDASGGTIFTDTDLLPLYNAAQSSLGIKLANAGAQIMKTFQTITTLVGTETSLDFSTTPALNTDLVVPLTIWEKKTGDADSTYTEMNERSEWLPNEDSTTQYRFWSWNGGAIQLLATTQANTLKILYVRQIAALTTGTDKIPIPGATNTLAWATLKLAAMSRGEAELGQYADAQYQDEYQALKRIYVKGNQRRPRRRAPYGGGSAGFQR